MGTNNCEDHKFPTSSERHKCVYKACYAWKLTVHVSMLELILGVF